MNSKKAKQYRKTARIIARDKQETTYSVGRFPAQTGRAQARWGDKGYPVVFVSPDCARGIYLQMKRDTA